MFSLGNGEIVPGERIGDIRLGMCFKELRQIVGEFEIRDLADYEVIVCADIKIWVSKERDEATQILVQGGFKGKYMDMIGLGSTLTDVQNLLKATWHEDLDTYVIDDAPGMCFELGDSGDDTYWDEMTAPIEYISVFPIEEDETPLA